METHPDDGFAARLRTATRSAHTDAEGSPFVAALVGGQLAPAAHAALLAQSHLVYAVLEEAAACHRGDPVAGPFLDPALLRLPALEADLAFLLGERWRDAVVATPATARYTARLREVAFDWPGGFVAHHYLRYLGDLSGGQVIRRMHQRSFGWTEDGLRFYAFDGIGAVKPYRDAYRARLDAAPWDAREQDRVVAEVALGYRLNRELFDDLESQMHRWAR